MQKDWLKIKIPRIIYTCCGIKYDSENPDTNYFFKCFVHKNNEVNISDFYGKNFDVNFCITIWLVCRNNNCITCFTFFYDYKNILRQKIVKRGIKYILKLKDKFLDILKINIPEITTYSKSKKYLWRYTDCNPRKKNVSNIYNLDDKKVGETQEQKVKTYKL